MKCFIFGVFSFFKKYFLAPLHMEGTLAAQLLHVGSNSGRLGWQLWVSAPIHTLKTPFSIKRWKSTHSTPSTLSPSLLPQTSFLHSRPFPVVVGDSLDCNKAWSFSLHFPFISWLVGAIFPSSFFSLACLVHSCVVCGVFLAIGSSLGCLVCFSFGLNYF